MYNYEIYFQGYLNEALDLALSTSQDTGEGADTSRLKELRECIYWRKGALLYMYCHTAYNNQPRLLPDDQQKSQFVMYAYDGRLNSITLCTNIAN